MTILLPIAQKCAAFICRNNPESLLEVEKLVENSLQGLFHTIADSITYSRKIELLKCGCVLSDSEGFKPATKDAILFRINLVNDRDEFIDMLFEELKATGGMQHNRWKLTVDDNELALFSLGQYIEPVKSTRVKAKVIKFI